MAKKRGGLAGIYDRNKKIIKPLATGLAGVFGTPALGAAVGAAFGGLDRPGKSGIGVDAMGAAKGGLSGYAMGRLGQAAQGGLGKMFTGGGVPRVPEMFGKEGIIEQNKTILSGIGKGVMGVREGAREDEQARLTREENARMFDEQQKLRVRQQGNLDQDAMMTKQQFDELNASRARLRAMLTGGRM